MMNQPKKTDQFETANAGETRGKSRSARHASRRELHGKKKKKEKKAPSPYPLINFLAVCFILLIVFIFTYTIYTQKHEPVNTDSGEVQFLNESTPQQDKPAETDKKLAAGNEDKSEKAEPKEQAPKAEAPKKESPSDAGKKTPASDGDSDQKEQPKAAPKASERSKEQEKKEEKKAPPAKEKEKPESKENKASGDSSSDSPAKENIKIVKHTVQPKETLYRISMKYYNSRSGEETIRKWNKLSADSVYAGQVLEIPLKDHV
ncbi:LysM peptidoglycan-binding domain-containing protein [Metabacillus sp. GX 13764]|uniref:LysM peptidoglycan-binding domain-containing protein n=1 Tax=Metabacillus kandeliae TaxID=2900151 RepID=UPI001E50A81E|nr:LysM peptidoglycan-binding domain-containing protein [Metabacillus kandeliae]MCD7033334.1 LysM peptidoglycan-binding domain-containing protein [Metabacillus kandeliae]